MPRPYKYMTIRQYEFVRKSVHDFMKPAHIAKELGIKTTQVRGIYRRMGLRIVDGNGMFTKGHIPHNKGINWIRASPETEFKIGHTPHNTKPVGTVRINKDGLKEIKYCKHKWRSYHSHVWILQKGQIPDGSVVIFKPGKDKNDFTVKDLKLVSRKQLLNLNQKNDTTGRK